MGVMVAIVVAVGSLLLIILLSAPRKDPLGSRLERVGSAAAAPKSKSPPSAKEEPEPESLLTEAPRHELLAMLMPSNQESRRQFGDRLVQAGLYKRNSYAAYAAAKGMLMLAPLVLGALAAASGLVPLKNAMLFGGSISLSGMIIPSFWLDSQLRRRQATLRKALPDALDVIIICLEGGLGLSASFAKVSSELRSVHPLLAAEMVIVQREIQMGRSTGEALRELAQRFDLEELRSIASVVLQAERFGSSVVMSLRVHADSLRERRLFQAEELAQKAAIKILMPTLFCIFPVLFVVLLGPAAFDLYELLQKMAQP
jgi:tight adherence protein C